MGNEIQESKSRLTWVLWDKMVDATFRSDFQTLVGQAIPPTAAQTMNGRFLHYCGFLSKDDIEKIGQLYGDYVLFSSAMRTG